LKAAAETVCRSEAGRLFQTLGLAMEKARSPSLVRVCCTAAAPFVVDLRDRVDEKLILSHRRRLENGEPSNLPAVN